MAANGYYDQDGYWHDPADEDFPLPGREQAPSAPPGYTVPLVPGTLPTPAPTATDTPPPATSTPTPGAPGAPYGGSSGMDTSYWTPPPAFTAPKFAAPPAFSFDKFAAPTAEAVLADPGYQFRLSQGQKALETSAAGRGVLRTGGTLKDLLSYGQNLGSQEYGNVYDRAMGAYKTNFETAADQYKTNYGVSRDVFDRTYRGALDEYNPQLQGWSAKMGMQQRASELEFQRQWDAYVQQQDEAYRYWHDNSAFGLGLPT